MTEPGTAEAPPQPKQRTFLERVINPQKAQSALITTASSLGAVVLAFIICGVLLEITGKDAFAAYQKMFSTGFSKDKLIETVQRASPLVISATAVAIGFKMNLFNIGVEGQYLFAVFIAAVVGEKVTMPAPFHPIFIMVVAMCAGAFWAGIAGVLKVTRGVNEVIATIMLNGIALAVIEWMFQTWFRYSANNSLNVTTQPLPPSGWIPDVIHGTSPLNGFVFIALLVSIVYYLLVFKSRFGFRLRASGMNPVAARTSGISSKRMIVTAMLLSGAVAGLVGMQSLLGNIHAYGLSIPTGFGFAGIAVALLGRNHPVGIIFAALLFGFLDSTAGALQLKGVPSPIIEVMQAIILFTVVIFNEIVTQWLNRRTQAKTAAALELAGATA